ncbi:MAG: CcdB family protein [Betaproteobacteria bacterium]|nr:CcdB family protein [Betaproteobacteria bacterium]
MAKYDVFPNPGAHARTTPYLLDVQSDLLDGLESRMVIPLRCLQDFPSTLKRPERLLPVLQIGDEGFLLDVPQMGAVPKRILRYPVASLAYEHDRIVAALDFLFQGV